MLSNACFARVRSTESAIQRSTGVEKRSKKMLPGRSVPAQRSVGAKVGADGLAQHAQGRGPQHFGRMRQGGPQLQLRQASGWPQQGRGAGRRADRPPALAGALVGSFSCLSIKKSKPSPTQG